MEVTALSPSPPVRCIVARGSNLVPRLASAADEYALAFASPPDATPPFECRSPELLLPIVATGEIERKAGVRLVDAACKPLPTTAFGGQNF
jgi:hypothetical protein